MSSRSQSSSRRSSSRRSSGRGGKSRGKKNSLKKSVAQNGINFWAMLGGFVFGLTVLFLILGLFAKDQINPELIAANDENRAEVATRVEKQDFDTFVEQASIVQLAETLTSLQEVREFKEDSDFRTNYERQQKIIDAMSNEALSKEHHRLTVLANIKSTSTAFWTDQNKPLGLPNLGSRLRDLTEMHTGDSDPEIAFQSRVALARLNSLEAADDVVSHSRELHQLLSDFPTDERVHKVITDSLIGLVSSSEKRSATIKILNHFLNQPKIVGNQKTKDLYLVLTDLWTLCDHDFFNIQENLLYTAKAGRDQMRAVCLDLAKVPTAGQEVVGQIGKSAEWMEKNGHYEHAIEIFQAMQTCADRLPNKKNKAEALQKTEWGIRRCKAVGKPFNLAVNTFDGKPLAPSTIQSMPVLLVFWSESDKSEIMLHAVAKASNRWQRNSVKIIAVQVEKDPSKFNPEKTQKRNTQFDRWKFCHDDGTGTGPIFSQVPAVENGRVVLLDREHRLYNVNVGLDELVTTVKKVLAIRGSGIE